MTIPVPSLSAPGWLLEISERADALMAYYITSEFSQSYLYYGKITSLPYHIKAYGSTPERLESRVEDDLGAYLRRYFEEVEITVRTDIPNEQDPNRIDLRLDVIVLDNGYRYSLGRQIKIQNKRIAEVFKINNQGQ